MIIRPGRRILVATFVCAVGVPVSTAAWLGARTAALAEHLGAAGGVPAHIGRVDADLTGAVRLSDVALGELVTADAIEASVALDSLLAGTLRADEIRVEGPRVAIHVDRDGDSDVARLARRLVHRAATAGSSGGSGASPGRLRRITVSAGTLSARIAGLGDLTADAVEIVPDAGGIRLITGALRLDGRAGPVAIELALARSAAELTLPQLQLGRVLAVGGTGSIAAAPGTPATPATLGGTASIAAAPGGPATPATLRGTSAIAAAPGATGGPGTPATLGGTASIAAAPGAPGAAGGPDAGDRAIDRALRLRGVALGRLAPGGTLELRASADDHGAPRPLAVDVDPRTLAIVIRGDRIPLRALAAAMPHGIDLGAARATGSLVVRRDAGRVAIDLDGAIDGAAIDHRVLATTSVPVAGAVRASIAVSPEAFSVPRAAIDLGAAHWTLSGWLRRDAPVSGQLDLSLATAACGDLLAALPAELRGPLDGLVLGGSFGARIRLAVDLAAPPGDGVTLTTSIADACRAEAEPPAADVSRLAAPDPTHPPRTPGGHARVPGSEPWAALRQLPGHVAAAFVSAEDARFYDHAGFDLDQIARSLEIDLREHRVARGGSTISQQLVKNAFLPPRRSFDRKLQEAVLTWRLEARLDKRQILERYLNIIELGPRVFGITAAARHWFGAAPRELSIRQAAFLAALTSEPTSMSRRVRRAGGLDPDSAARVDVVLRAMRRDGALDAEQYEAAKAAPLRFARTALGGE